MKPKLEDWLKVIFLLIVVAVVVVWVVFFWTNCAFTPIAEAPAVCLAAR